MALPGDFAYTVKQQADIVRIVGDYVKLKKAGAQNFTGLCPFHGEKTPSFSVHATRQFYHCFGCGSSGDVLGFVQKIENITFPEALRVVAEKCGIPLPKSTPASAAESKEAQLRARLLDLHERATLFFSEQLQKPEGARAREYLASRGLAAETIKQFHIGYAPESGFLLRDRLKPLADEETLKASGLLSWKQGEEGEKQTAANALYARFRNRIMFPIASESGKIVAFTGRTLSTDSKAGPKYLNSPETAIYSKSRVLFNLDQAKEHIRALDYAILVEGQMDCISVFAGGFKNVVASSGTAFTEAQVRLLGRYSKRVVVNFDPDAAGAAATERSLALLVSEDFAIKVLTLEPGLDPDLFIRKKGREAYAAALKTAPEYFEHLIERARANFRVATPDGKVKAVNFLLPHLQRVQSRIKRDELAAEMAHKLGIDSAVLRQELKHAVGEKRGGVRTHAHTQITDAEKILLRALSSQGELRQRVVEALASGELESALDSAALVHTLVESAVPHDLTGLAIAETDRTVLAGILLNEDESEEITLELIEKALVALRRKLLERRRRQLKHDIAEAERKRDQGQLTQLMQEQRSIERALAAHH